MDNKIEWWEAEEQLQEIYYNKLKWCGCGDPQLAQVAIYRYLKTRCENYEERMQKFREYFGVAGLDEDPLLLCLAYAIDAAGLTEHGCSISGAWLTEDGKRYIELMEICLQEPALEYASIQASWEA